MLGATLVHEHQNPIQILQMNKDDYRLSLPISQIFYDPQQEAWRAQAACKNTPVDVFFPDKGASKQKTEAARAICNECAVKQDCGDWSLQFSERALVGIWAGMTTIERRRERRRLGLAK